MGLFKKKENDANKGVPPQLPELPKLPDFPSMHDFSYSENSFSPSVVSQNASPSLPQLPKYPNNPIGNKFSQNTIKEAIAGKKEEEVDAEDFPEPEVGLMQKPLHRYSMEGDEEDEEEFEDEPKVAVKPPRTKEAPSTFVQKSFMTKKAEPIFIRLDKFEESAKTFEEIKSQLAEIEQLIKNTKEIKAKEDEELSNWEKEVQSIKNEIEKVNQDIFSRIE